MTPQEKAEPDTDPKEKTAEAHASPDAKEMAAAFDEALSAVRMGKAERLGALLENFPGLRFATLEKPTKRAGGTGDTLLHVAARGANLELIQLLRAHCSIDAVNAYGETPLIVAIAEVDIKTVGSAVNPDRLACLRELVAHSDTSIRDANGNSVWMWAAACERAEVIRLLRPVCDEREINENGLNAFGVALEQMPDEDMLTTSECQTLEELADLASEEKAREALDRHGNNPLPRLRARLEQLELGQSVGGSEAADAPKQGKPNSPRRAFRAKKKSRRL